MEYKLDNGEKRFTASHVRQIYIARVLSVVFLATFITLLVLSGQQSDTTKKNNLFIFGMVFVVLFVAVMLYNGVFLL